MPRRKRNSKPANLLAISNPFERGFDPARDRLVNTKVAADILGCKPGTLAKARTYGGAYACPYVKMGASVRYSTRALAEHIEGKTANSTSQALLG